MSQSLIEKANEVTKADPQQAEALYRQILAQPAAGEVIIRRDVS